MRADWIDGEREGMICWIGHGRGRDATAVCISAETLGMGSELCLGWRRGYACGLGRRDGGADGGGTEWEYQGVEGGREEVGGVMIECHMIHTSGKHLE